jgi:hypothetical protein
MRPLALSSAFAVVLAWLGPPPLVRAQNPKVVPAPHQEWTTALAGSRAKLEFTAQVPAGFKGRLVWTLAEAETQRVLPRGRGEAPLGGGARGKIEITFPDVNPGVVLKTLLTIALVDDANGNAVATQEKTIRIFHPNPFADRVKILKDLKIALYDPDPTGKTADALKGLDIPFEEEKNLAALEERKDAIVMVGEGVSFKDEAGLAEALVKLAARGTTVICLAPSAGTVPIPGTEQGHDEDVSFFRRGIIKKLDKRLDDEAWGDGQVVASTLALKAVEGSVVGEVIAGAGGWPWLQVDYPHTRGRLIVCGFAVIGRWQASPTPRYLLAKMMQHAMPAE